jgi:hypothetical protein
MHREGGGMHVHPVHPPWVRPCFLCILFHQIFSLASILPLISTLSCTLPFFIFSPLPNDRTDIWFWQRDREGGVLLKYGLRPYSQNVSRPIL